MSQKKISKVKSNVTAVPEPENPLVPDIVEGSSSLVPNASRDAPSPISSRVSSRAATPRKAAPVPEDQSAGTAQGGASNAHPAASSSSKKAGKEKAAPKLATEGSGTTPSAAGGVVGSATHIDNSATSKGNHKKGSSASGAASGSLSPSSESATLRIHELEHELLLQRQSFEKDFAELRQQFDTKINDLASKYEQLSESHERLEREAQEATSRAAEARQEKHVAEVTTARVQASLMSHVAENKELRRAAKKAEKLLDGVLLENKTLKDALRNPPVCEYCVATRAEGDRFRKQNKELRDIIAQMEDEERRQLPYSERVRPLNKNSAVLKQQLLELEKRVAEFNDKAKMWQKEKVDLEKTIKTQQVTLTRLQSQEQRLMELEVQNQLLVTMVQKNSKSGRHAVDTSAVGATPQRQQSTSKAPRVLPPLIHSNMLDQEPPAKPARLLPPLPRGDGKSAAQSSAATGGQRVATGGTQGTQSSRVSSVSRISSRHSDEEDPIVSQRQSSLKRRASRTPTPTSLAAAVSRDDRVESSFAHSTAPPRPLETSTRASPSRSPSPASSRASSHRTSRSLTPHETRTDLTVEGKAIAAVESSASLRMEASAAPSPSNAHDNAAAPTLSRDQLSNLQSDGLGEDDAFGQVGGGGALASTSSMRNRPQSSRSSASSSEGGNDVAPASNSGAVSHDASGQQQETRQSAAGFAEDVDVSDLETKRSASDVAAAATSAVRDHPYSSDEDTKKGDDVQPGGDDEPSWLDD